MHKPMKAFRLLPIFYILLFAACTAPDGLRTGDLLFVSLPMTYSRTMPSDTTADASELNYIHAAILEVDDSAHVWVIDATLRHGVDRHPLATFLSDFTLRSGDLPGLHVMRLNDATHAATFVENAKQYLGEPYDSLFAPANGMHYCTELIRDAYVTPDGEHLFPLEPMDFTRSDGQLACYWREFFQFLHHSSQGDPGTTPRSILQSPLLHPVELTLTIDN